MHGRPSVIQGSFPRGLSHLTSASRSVQRTANTTVIEVPAHLARFHEAGGQPLPTAVRQKMERIFGTSFTDVRVHTGPHVGALGAAAFAQGSHLHFAPGQYNPDTAGGQQILGHELTHVVQQRTGRARNPFAGGMAVVHDVLLEAEADRMRMRVALSPAQTAQRITTSRHFRLRVERSAAPVRQRLAAPVRRGSVAQPLTDEAWKALYQRADDLGEHLGLRFQSGPALPTTQVHGDRYGLTDHRYAPSRMERSDAGLRVITSTLDAYNTALAASVTAAVDDTFQWLVHDNGLTLRAVFDKIRNAGQLALLTSPAAYRKDYDQLGAFASVGKQHIDPTAFLCRIALITPLEYDHYRTWLDQPWTGANALAVRSYLVAQVLKRVDDAITLHVGRRVSQYAIPPSWDDDPSAFMALLDDLA